MRELQKQSKPQLVAIIQAMQDAGAEVPSPGPGEIVSVRRRQPQNIATNATALEDACTSACDALDSLFQVRYALGAPWEPHPEIEAYRAATADFVALLRGT